MSFQHLYAPIHVTKLIKSHQIRNIILRQLKKDFHHVGIPPGCRYHSTILRQLMSIQRQSPKVLKRCFHRTCLKYNQNNRNPRTGGPPFDRTLILLGLTMLIYNVLVDFVVPLFSKYSEISFQQFIDNYLKKGKVQGITVIPAGPKKDYWNVFFKMDEQDQFQSSSEFFVVENLSNFEKKITQAQLEMNVTPDRHVAIMYESNRTGAFTYFLMFMLFGLMLLGVRSFSRFSRNIDSMVDKQPAKMVTEDTGVKFKDVAGCEEAKIEIMEFVNFLKNPQQYVELGAKIPKGALLNGPPGTGKTLLAKATAGEAGVPFIAASGSEFLEIFVGVGPDRVRKMFKTARENAPCIVFIDEIDAIGTKRAGSNSIDDERSNTLNQLLVEMDGFESERGVIVMAATNRLNILDKALLRPGRFDRQIYVGSPDIKGRTSIFKVHLKKLKTALDKDEIAKKMATLTPGFSGAEIMNVCNEAALIAVRHSKTMVEMEHFDQAIERVVAGMEKRTRVLIPSEKRKIAFHEAGKTVTAWFSEHASPILKISLIPRGDKLSFSMSLPKEKYLQTQEQLIDMMCCSLGGVVAEEMEFGHFSSRAEKELKRVTELAYAQVTQYGMSPLVGHLSFQDQESVVKPYSQDFAELIDSEVKKIIDFAYSKTKELLNKHKTDVEKVANTLLEKEKLDKVGLEELLGPRPFEELTKYEDIVEGTGSQEENTQLPSSLGGWNKTVGASADNHS
ncbi:AFG3-like protein 2 isoform X1 [Dreissena polymorpha]|uniref:AFG3-like protein 2 isoform X1 n=2 Tax=Dreissena polymorpha TaxID=45954 RepID=UPI00226562D4|nr:AFG3-like protein 2 isoform X1 [Dreissena polymorpha]